MTETTVQYHVDRSAYPARPAINVKLHAAGYDLWPVSWLANPPGTSDRENIVQEAYDRVQSDFWQAASEIATQRGLGEIEQEGRSGGWLVFTDGRDPQSMVPDTCSEHVNVREPDCDGCDTEAAQAAEQSEWLAAYRAMTEWAEATIADAPRRIRSLAQDLAMDEAGERTIAFRSWLAWGRTYAL